MQRLLLLIIILAFCPAFPNYKYKKVPEDGKPEKPVQVTGEYLRSADKQYRSGLQLYRAGKADKALPFFSKVIKKYGKSPVAEESAVMAAQCHLRLENYEEARWILRFFPRRYPQSRLLSRCAYLSGILLASGGDGFGAARKFLEVYQENRHPDLVRLSGGALRLLFQYRLTPDQLLELSARMVPSDSLRGIALFEAGRLFLGVRELEQGRNALSSYLEGFGGQPASQRARALIDSVQKLEKSALKVGVLIPRTAENTLLNEIGQSVLKGIEAAVEAHNREGGIKVELLVRDTRANTVLAFEATQELIDREKVAAIIGPLSTDELCATAALAENRGVPVISPTASAVGDVVLGSHVFLLTPTKINITRRLVDYAFDSLRISEYAVVFPNDEYGSVMAGSFRDAVEERGGTLLAYEMYTVGEKNFKNILDRIHEKKVEQIFEDRAMAEGGLLGSVEDRRVEVDSSFMADSAVRVGAIFMPGYPEEIIMLGPQVPFYKIHTQMLGGSGWYLDANVVKHAGRYIDSAVVAVDFIYTGNTPAWKRFREHYALRYNDNPDLKASLGYDALNFVLSAGEKEGREVLKKLQKHREYDGVLCKYQFDERSNSNKAAVLLRIVDEAYRQIHLNP
jgi:branched-chain amino acid transport system substrate-binding protein